MFDGGILDLPLNNVDQEGFSNNFDKMLNLPA